MKQVEIIGKRKEKEKHFLQEDGTIVAEMYNENIHFLKNGQYEEIDNTLILQDDYYINKNNEYSVSFASKPTSNIMKIQKNGHYINLFLEQNDNFEVELKNFKSKINSRIIYHNVLKNIDIYYDINSSQVKENIVVNSKDNELDKLMFNIETDLSLKINNDGSISATFNGEEIFKFDSPYMFDSKNIKSDKVTYNLIKEDNNYQLFMFTDSKWLGSNAIYPVIIDPTITSYSENDNVYDTFIYPGDTNVDRNSLTYLKAGVERVNGKDIINRTLLKFNLPEIGTGSQIIKASLNLTDYPDYFDNYEYSNVNFHRITQDWDEKTANWNTMNDKFDERVEGVCTSYRWFYTDDKGTITDVSSSSTDITSLVQKWYTNIPNYGIMLRTSEEIYKTDGFPMFFSKNNAVTVGYNPKPLLVIAYRNQNGLEDYMNYEVQKFSKGISYNNTYNGNLTQVFEIGSTKNSKMPVKLNLVYNTNDVILNKNIGFGKGYRLNINQTIKEVEIDNRTYLEYVDADGTLHYFLNEKTQLEDGQIETDNTYNIYYDEDGLNLEIEKNDSNYIMRDKNGYQMFFEKHNDIGYLTEIRDVSGNINTISYDVNYERIFGIEDSDNQWISIIYNTNYISIMSPDQTVGLSFLDSNILNSIIYDGGTIYLFHNENNLVWSVRDITDKEIHYEYYSEIPYKLKKITEIGLNNTIGNYYDIEYGFNTTTITDSKNRVRTISFNNYGNPLSISSLKEKNDITNAYGYNIEYGESMGNYNVYKNKLLSQMIPLKYVKNLLEDTSFENSTMSFSYNQNTEASISEEYASSGFKSLKFEALSSFEPGEITKKVQVEKGNYYTFSAYVKTSLYYTPVKLCIGYYNENDIFVEVSSDSIANPEGDFERLNVTIFYPESATSDLILKCRMDSRGICYVDDIQLEEGEVANNYNLIENSDFSSGFNDWDLYTGEGYSLSSIFSVVDVDNQKALKVNMFTSNISSMQKMFNISGKAGDHFTLSFWYKNEGLNGTPLFEEGPKNVVSITFYPDNDTGFGGDVIENYSLNPSEDQWQFFIHDFYADFDFKNFRLVFDQELNGNEFYITNINFFKDIRSVKYDYDENGNLTKIKKLNEETKEFKYDKNNEIIKMTDAMGSNFIYEYDNVVTDKVLRGVSGTGISNEIVYDSVGNPIISRVTNRGQMTCAKNGIYKIRLKGTNKALRLINNSISLIDDSHGHDKWNLEKVIIDNNDYYKISHSIINNKYFTNNNNYIVLSEYQEDNSLFELQKQDNGSFYIKNKLNDMYIKDNNNTIVLESLIKDDPSFEFYFESITSGQFIETSMKYTEDGKFITKTIDTNLCETNYEIDTSKGLVQSITNSKNQTIYYDYDNSNRIMSIKNNNKQIDYEYNNNVLSKIIENNRIYNFDYDEFLNIKSINVGNQVVLFTNNYEHNNGNLISTTYGNNQTVNYEYDEFDRIKKVTKNDDTYNYKYDNNGDLVKITSNDNIIKYTYDLSKRLYEYNNNDFKIKYEYDSNDNIISKLYTLDNKKYKVDNVLDENDSTIKSDIDGKEINYNYDDLGRLVSINIGDNYQTKYTYMTKGKRTTTIVDSIINNDDKYSYKYDSLSNITEIYHNNILENKYYYDDYNQLIKEDNYITNKTIQYEYNDLGNILHKTEYEINTNNQLKQIKYKYNDPNWCDLLTEFDNNIIKYDNLGNPISIGDNIVLSWKNGIQLGTYMDSNNVIKYKYNKDGLRTSKIINSKETKYYLEGSKIVFEQTDNDTLYYIRDNDNLIGLKYNDTIYYYLKNNKNDIIGILDNNFTSIAQYTYDSWGNIISITDENNNDISNDMNHIANINPYRYRSYYYDKETKLYYLNSRYYNPEWGRFISIDSSMNDSINIKENLYTYCANDPINNVDPSGQGWLKDVINKVKKAIKKVYEKVQEIVSNYMKTETRTATVKENVSFNLLEQIKISNGTQTKAPITKSENKKSASSFDINYYGNYSTIEISTDIKEKNISYESGAFAPASVTVTCSSGFTVSVGIDMMDIYVNWGKTIDSDGVLIYNYNQVEVNKLIFALAVVAVVDTAPISLPAISIPSLASALSYAF